MTTGQLIRAARKKAKMTQAELAEKLGISYVGVSQWENGARNPKYDTVKKIAAALNVDWTELVPQDKQCGLITEFVVESAGLTVKDENGNILQYGNEEPSKKMIFSSEDLRANHELLTFNATPDPEWEFLYHKIEDGTANDEERQAFAKLFQDSLIKSNLAIEKITDKLSEIINCMTVLNEDGQQRVLMFAVDLAEIPKYRKSTQIRETEEKENINESTLMKERKK